MKKRVTRKPIVNEGLDQINFYYEGGQPKGSPELLDWIDKKFDSIKNLVWRCVNVDNNKKDRMQAQRVLYAILPPMIEKARVARELDNALKRRTAVTNPRIYLENFIRDMAMERFNYLDQRSNVRKATNENRNVIKLTESDLHRIVAECTRAALEEYANLNEDKDSEMNSDWRNYGNLNRFENPGQEISADEHLGLTAQHKHNSVSRSGARGIKNGTYKSGQEASFDYFDKHRGGKIRW